MEYYACKVPRSASRWHPWDWECFQKPDADDWKTITMSLSIEEVDKIFSELNQFRVPDDHRGNAQKNEFWKIEEAELADAEKRMGIMIPHELRRFYAKVGSGHLVRSRKGVLQTDYLNIFVDLRRLSELWLREDVSFQYDAELVADGELPFFDMGSYSYFVLRPHSANPNAVYAPYDKKPVSNSFNEFVLQLYQDTTFYLDHVGDYEV
ncbi:SMI1/KNR4 family protein [Roseibium algicola]|nr:SMI1/KNR4 family protein [Roseibium aggregatum]